MTQPSASSPNSRDSHTAHNDIRVDSIYNLHLPTGVCDSCGKEEWVILVTINREKPIAFYLCDADRRDLIEKLVSV
jgi:hypothetical protein